MDKILKTHPENVEALLYSGVIHIEEKDYAKAVDALDQVLEEHPSNPNALRNRAIAFLQLGKLDEAKQDYLTLNRLVPNYWVAHYGLGEVAYRRKRHSEAIRNYELYLEAAPAPDTQELAAERKLVEERLKELKAASP